LVLELPRWLFENLRRSWILWILAAFTFLNLYLTYTSRNGGAVFDPAPRTGKQLEQKDAKHLGTTFSKTFVFWVPDFASQTKRLSDPAVLEVQFHKALVETFGGWTRWRASGEGAGSTAPEDGWIYQASLSKDKDPDDMSVRDVQKLIRRHFLESSIYVVEMRHQ
jgi:hypothetical protein